MLIWPTGALLACVGAALLTLASAAGVRADEYRINSQEKLNVRVIIWQADESEYQEVEAVSGEFVVGPTGQISIPMIGGVEASGMTTGELAEVISERLRNLLGKPDLSTAIEILEFRPIYVVGDVVNPGEYAFRPDMTVLQAVSIAGGTYSGRDLEGLRFGRDAITAEGNYALIQLEIRRMLARRARLEAEIEGSETIDFPPEVAGDADGIGGRLMEEEKSIMRRRHDALTSQLEAFDELIALFEAEVESLTEKIDTQNRQIGLAEADLRSTRSLVDRGLAVQSRLVDAEQEVARLGSSLLDLETAVLRARQQISEASRGSTSLRNDNAMALLTELQETQAQLDDLHQEARTASGLYAEAAITAPSAARALSAARDQAPTYTLARVQSGGTLEDVAIGAGERVRPGDVIRVELPRLDEEAITAIQ